MTLVTDVPGSILVTGCYRSGTTVVEKILNMHPAVTVASQPFPILYFLSKERFNRSIGVERRYPLDHLFLEDAYTAEDLDAFLNTDVLDRSALAELVRRMREYHEGLWTPEILDVLEPLCPGTFFDLHAQLNQRVDRLFPKPGALYVGSKEVLVEELADPLVRQGCRVVFVVRDPRAMISSLNFAVRDNKTGMPRPVLYSLRAWRKSVALAIAGVARGGVCLVRYEDLVHDVRGKLAKLTGFLEVDTFADDALAGGIRDQHGNPWRGNSSFADQDGVSTRSVGAFAERLPLVVRNFIEVVCAPEMALLGYAARETNSDHERALATYCDPFESLHPSFPPDYSSDPARIVAERERLRLLRAGLGDPAEMCRWFLAPEAYEGLAAAWG